MSTTIATASDYLARIAKVRSAMVAKQEKAEGALSLDDFPPADLPGIKQIRYDGNDFFLSSLNPVLGGLLSNPPCLILAVLRQIQVTA